MRLSPEQQERYLVRAYIDDMPAAMHAADLVVSRSGASTLGELPAAGVPAILVPGEYEGWSQAPNAEYLQSRGAAVDAAQRRARAPRGHNPLHCSMTPPSSTSMSAAARALARPQAAADLARILTEVAA